MELELPIFHHSDNTISLKDMGIDYSLSDCEVKPITFYNINAISVYIDGENEYCSIHCNNLEYICPQTHREVKSLIRKAKNNN